MNNVRFPLSRGFTLIEVLITLSILTVIIGLPMIFFWGIGRNNNLVSATREVISTINEAQNNAISGRSMDGEQPTNYGVYFGQTYYVLFPGSSYNPNGGNNLQTDLPTGITFSQISLPGSTVAFANVTGKVVGFNANNNFVVITDSQAQTSKRITVSSIGGVTYQ